MLTFPKVLLFVERFMNSAYGHALIYLEDEVAARGRWLGEGG